VSIGVGLVVMITSVGATGVAGAVTLIVAGGDEGLTASRILTEADRLALGYQQVEL
jgi:hypothetical protein